MINDKLLHRIASCVPIFAGMPLPCLLKTVSYAEQWPMKSGDVFFSEGDQGSAFFVLLTGEAVVEKESKGKFVRLVNLEPGDCFGEMVLVDQRPRSATVRAISDVLSLRFSKQKLDAFPEAAAFVYQNIAKVLAKRLSNSNEVTAKLLLDRSLPVIDKVQTEVKSNRHTRFDD